MLPANPGLPAAGAGLGAAAFADVFGPVGAAVEALGWSAVAVPIVW